MPDGLFFIRKSTFTGLLTSFDSFIPLSDKKGLIFSLLKRYFNYCSAYLTFHAGLEKLKDIFIKNGYPENFLDDCVASFFDKIFRISSVTTTAPIIIICISLPFTYSNSNTLKKTPFVCLSPHSLTVYRSSFRSAFSFLSF